MLGCINVNFDCAVSGYFGKRHLLRNKEFFRQSSKTNFCKMRTMKTTFLYIFCVVTFPIFNVTFKAVRLFQATTPSSDSFALEMDQVKALFEDSPQLALQLYISFKREPQIIQILAIALSSLTVALPNLRSLKTIKNSRIKWDWDSKMQTFKSLARRSASDLLFFDMFVFVSFTRAATIAVICCFLSYNALIVYFATFVALKIIFELAKLSLEHEALKKISKERIGDIIANAFNILDLRHDSFVTICYAVFWMIFNMATMGLIIAYEKYVMPSSGGLPVSDMVSGNATTTIPISLWIAPTFELTDWSDIFIRKQGLHLRLLLVLFILNFLSCIIIVVLTTSINKSKERKKEEKEEKEEYDDVVRRGEMLQKEGDIEHLTTENKMTETKNVVPDDVTKEIWAPYDNLLHYQTVQRNQLENQRSLSTMTQLLDPWDFVSDCANKLLTDKDARIDQFEYEDAHQLLLRIMNESVKFMRDDPRFAEVFERCKRQYLFLEQLEQERKEERFAELEERFEELEENETLVPPQKPEDKSAKHEKASVTSEKTKNTKQSSLRKWLAEKAEENFANQTLKMNDLEKDLSEKQTEVDELKTALAAAEKAASERAHQEKATSSSELISLEKELKDLKDEVIRLKASLADAEKALAEKSEVVPYSPEKLLRYEPIQQLLEVLKAICLHMRIISLGVRDIKKSFKIIEVGEEGWVWIDEEIWVEVEQKKEFEGLFKVLQKQIAEYGKTSVPEIEQIVRNVKTVFVSYVEFFSENQTDEEELLETLDELKDDVKRFKTKADEVAKKEEKILKDLANVEVKVVESLGKFNDVTDRYKKEMEILEEGSKVPKKILAAWKLISLGISIEVTKEESRCDKSDLSRKAEFIRKRNEIRENIAITTKAVIIPSFKKYTSCVKSLAKFFNDLLEDLEKGRTEEADVREFFDQLQQGSADVNETCTQFITAMSEVRTDLGVLDS